MSIPPLHPLDNACRRAEALVARGHWWEAHETLESIWRALPPGPLRLRLRAAVQVVAVAHKLSPEAPVQHASRAGALRILERARVNAQLDTADPTDPLAAWLGDAVRRLGAAEPHAEPSRVLRLELARLGPSAGPGAPAVLITRAENPAPAPSRSARPSR